MVTGAAECYRWCTGVNDVILVERVLVLWQLLVMVLVDRWWPGCSK